MKNKAKNKNQGTESNVLKKLTGYLLDWFFWIAIVLVVAITIVMHNTGNHFIAFGASVACMCIGILLFIGRYVQGKSYKYLMTDKKKRYELSPFNLLLILLSVSIFFMFLPIYDIVEGHKFERTLLLSIHNTMRLFVLDGDFAIINQYLGAGVALSRFWARALSVYSSIMFVLAPIMTAGFVLSFVKDTWARILYFIRWGKEVYYMSELNSSSIAFAKNIRLENKKAVIVFFDVYHAQNEEHCELMERALACGAICFRKDISAVGLKRGRRIRKFFFIGENEEENIKQAINLVKRCKDEIRVKDNAEFYIFTTAADSELLIDAIPRQRARGEDLKIRRIDVTKNLAISTLVSNCEIFPKYSITSEQKKSLDIVIVGIGAFGTELLKAYCWATQLPNCIPNIHIIDKDENLRQRLNRQFPDLMSHGKKQVETDTTYKISIYDGVDVNGDALEDIIEKIHSEADGGIDIIFVCLGNDELNVRVAMDIRRIVGRRLCTGESLPIINSVVFSTRKTEIFQKLNEENANTSISYIGSMSEVYSLEKIQDKELEEKAFIKHLEWSHREIQSAIEEFKKEKTTQRQEVKEKKNKVINDYLSGKNIDKKTRHMLSSKIGEKEDALIRPLLLSLSDKLDSVIEKIDDFDAVDNTERLANIEINSIKASSPELQLTEAELEAQRAGAELLNLGEYPEITEIKALLKDACGEDKELRELCEDVVYELCSALVEEIRRVKNYFLVCAKRGMAKNISRYECVEYFRRSSIARAAYEKIRSNMGVPSNSNEVARFEHARWNAFMRSEGYTYGSLRRRSDLYKLHYDLVPYDKLAENEKKKDM